MRRGMMTAERTGKTQSLLSFKDSYTSAVF
jgi:hypothetical protein